MNMQSNKPSMHLRYIEFKLIRPLLFFPGPDNPSEDLDKSCFVDGIFI